MFYLHPLRVKRVFFFGEMTRLLGLGFLHPGHLEEEIKAATCLWKWHQMWGDFDPKGEGILSHPLPLLLLLSKRRHLLLLCVLIIDGLGDCVHYRQHHRCRRSVWNPHREEHRREHEAQHQPRLVHKIFKKWWPTWWIMFVIFFLIIFDSDDLTGADHHDYPQSHPVWHYLHILLRNLGGCDRETIELANI